VCQKCAVSFDTFCMYDDHVFRNTCKRAQHMTTACNNSRKSTTGTAHEVPSTPSVAIASPTTNHTSKEELQRLRDAAQSIEDRHWTNNNFKIISDILSCLQLSKADAKMLLSQVRYFLIEWSTETRITTFPFLSGYLCQLSKLDTRLALPASLEELERDRNSNLDPKSSVFEELVGHNPPVSKSGVPMFLQQNWSLYHFDLWYLVTELLCAHHDQINWHFVETLREDGTRIVGELHTAEWWKRNEALGGCALLAVILFSDETTINTKWGKVHPVYLTLGNLPVAARYAFSLWHSQ
jgi:hypothetical protein